MYIYIYVCIYTYMDHISPFKGRSVLKAVDRATAASYRSATSGGSSLDSYVLRGGAALDLGSLQHP